jgi:hypothetical protein
VSTRGTRATGAEEHDSAKRNVRQPGLHRPCETGRVSVVSDRLTVAEHDGVHRTNRTGRRINTIEVFEYDLFTRMGDVESVVPSETSGGKDLPDTRTKLVKVQPPVEVTQTKPISLALVQRGTQRRTDARAHKPDEVAVHTMNVPDS